MSKILIARRIGVALDRAEMTLDRTVADVAALVGLLPDARLQAGLAATAGQRVFEGVGETLSLLTQARGRLVESHRRLDALRAAMGLPPTATGPVDKPDESGPREPPGHLPGIEQAA